LYSQEHIETPPEQVLEDLMAVARPYIGEAPLKNWWYHRWRYAYPLNPIPKEYMALGLNPGLFFSRGWVYVTHALGKS
jgi:predicted NAD/FAD-dependent oxidoreductase